MLLADLEIDLLAFKLRRKGADLMLDNPLFPPGHQTACLASSAARI